jgi:hypothetical protein
MVVWLWVSCERTNVSVMNLERVVGDGGVAGGVYQIRRRGHYALPQAGSSGDWGETQI